MKEDLFVKSIGKNILLRDFTTFKIGGRAKYFFEAKTKEEIITAVKWAKENKLPFFVLGGGSNILVDDKGFPGLVIKPQTANHKLQTNKVYAEAGVKIADLIKLSIKEGLSGLEWAAGIPGITVGGAIRGNAGAFGKFVSDIVKEVEVFDAKDLKVKKLTLKDCDFNYKETIFKKSKNLIILSAVLALKKRNKKEIKNEIDYVLSYRKTYHPQEPSAGSVFKNKELKIKNKKLLKSFPLLRKFNKKGIIPAAWLIEQCGLKGKKIGGAQISEKHANFIVNFSQASSEDVKRLINLIKKEVKKKFGLKLEEEIYVLSQGPSRRQSQGAK